MKNLLFFIFLLPLPVGAETSGLVGQWKTVDDATGKAKSTVEIFKAGETYNGLVAEIIEPKEPNPVCKECSGDKKNKPIKGLEIIWDMKEDKTGQEWTGGRILDPENGKTYSCRLRLKDNGEKLEVRGFLGFSLLGRSQIWERLK